MHCCQLLLASSRLIDGLSPATLPRLTKYLFGMFGTARIKAQELDNVLDDLRKLILRAEFDLYAKPHPTTKKEQVISVHDFAITLISCFDPDRLPDYFERVHKLQASNVRCLGAKMSARCGTDNAALVGAGDLGRLLQVPLQRAEQSGGYQAGLRAHWS